MISMVSVSTRLPRSRGDRPSRLSAAGLLARAPPLARGSTALPHGLGRGPAGSPARAGIDPWRGSGRPAARWLPRSRGDRPVCVRRARSKRMAPPLARGSTRVDEAVHGHVDGSPARAGIDPAGCRPRGCSRGLPRSRGDRPVAGVQGSGRLSAPPLARGSIRRPVGRHQHACAGARPKPEQAQRFARRDGPCFRQNGTVPLGHPPRRNNRMGPGRRAFPESSSSPNSRQRPRYALSVASVPSAQSWPSQRSKGSVKALVVARSP